MIPGVESGKKTVVRRGTLRESISVDLDEIRELVRDDCEFVNHDLAYPPGRRRGAKPML